MIKLPKPAEWTFAILLAALFIAVGLSKFAGAPAARWTERFQHWGYPPNTQYVVGLLEMLGGVGILIPRLRRTASIALGVVMIGALVTHVVHAELSRVVPPVVLGGLAWLIYFTPRGPRGS